MDKQKNSELPSWFLETRKKGISSSGNLVFTLLRILDLPLQYHLLKSGMGESIVRKLGGTPTPASAAAATALGLSPYQSLIMGLATGAAAKQIYWCLLIGDNVFKPSFATGIAAYNTLHDTVNTLLSLWIVSSNSYNPSTWIELLTVSPNKSSVGLGLVIYVVGLVTEWYSEVQRSRFKQNPQNKGKLYTGGLFGLARNINYGGYTLCRVGYSIVCAGLPWGIVVGLFLFGDFAGRAVPYLETYLEKKVSRTLVRESRKAMRGITVLTVL